MSFRHYLFLSLLVAAAPMPALSQSTEDATSRVLLELNAVQNVGEACRLTFVANNETGAAIEKAVFETVIFDTSGSVVSLSLFDFRDLPANRLRVRQFDLPGMVCENVGRALINGANSCIVEGSQSEICDQSLELRSRLDVELLG